MIGNRTTRSSSKDSRLRIEGLSETYIQGEGARFELWLSVNDLSYHVSFSGRAESFDREEHFSGKATLREGSLGVAGKTICTGAIEFVLRPYRTGDDEPEVSRRDTDEDTRSVIIGHIPEEMEIGFERPEAWYIEAHVPQPAFKELLGRWKEGATSGVEIACTTNLWMVDDGSQLLPDVAPSLFLAPSEFGGASQAKGTVFHLSWTEVARSNGSQPLPR